MPSDFVHLHVHGQHSLLDGLIKPDDAMEAVLADQQIGIAQTDHGHLGGIMKSAKAAKEAGVEFWPGAELYLSIGSRHEKNHVLVEAEEDFDGSGGEDTEKKTKRKIYEHLTVIAGTKTGWRNLMLIQHEAHDSFYMKPRADYDLLAAHSEGLTVGSGCLGGPVAGQLLAGNVEQAEANLQRLVDIFGADKVFVEVMDHGIAIERKIVPDLVRLARRFGLPVVATNDAHYTHAHDADTHDSWLCISASKGKQAVTKDTANRFRFNGSGYHLKTAAEMHAMFDDQPGTENAVSNTMKVIENFESDIVLGSVAPYHRIPDPGVPAGMTLNQYFHSRVRAGLLERYGSPLPAEVRNRARLEENVIENFGVMGYFLVIADVIAAEREAGGLVGAGRGCLAGDTPIWTTDGYRRLDAVKVGDHVRTHTGAVRPVAATFRYPVTEDLVRIGCWYGGDPVTMTRDHKVLVRRAVEASETGELEWVEAGSVSEGDWLCVPRPKSDIVASTIDLASFVPADNGRTTFVVGEDFITETTPVSVRYPYSIHQVSAETGINRGTLGRLVRREGRTLKRTTDRLDEYVRSCGFEGIAARREHVQRHSVVRTTTPRHIRLDGDLAFLLGAWVSNGWTQAKDRRTFGFATQRSTDDGTIPTLVRSVFHLDVATNDSKTSDVRQFIGMSSVVAGFFEALSGSYGHEAASKTLPAWVLGLPLNVRFRLLEGLGWGDGHVSDGQWNYDTVSPALAHRVRDLVWSVGAPAGVSSEHQHDERSYRVRTARNFGREEPPSERRSWASDNDYVYQRVRVVETVSGVDEVFDLSVPVDHSFMTDSYVVHNSGPGSICAYALGITHLDPLRHGLLFERFLNPDRKGLPDFDTDFQSTRQWDIIRRTAEHYGSDRVARIGTYGQAWAKDSLKKLGRVTEQTKLADQLAAAVPNGDSRRNSLEVLLDPKNPMGEELRTRIADSGEQADALVKAARVIEGSPSNETIHACGVVISDEPLPGIVPLRRTSHKQDEDPFWCTEWDAGDSEAAELIKFDFLAIADLDVCAMALESIEADTGEHVDFYGLDPDADDERAQRTREMLAAGRTAGVSQLSSSGMTELCRDIRPDSHADLSALIALYRPGPRGADQHRVYARRRRGGEPVGYEQFTRDPAEAAVLERTLSQTMGSLTYQEDLMEIGREVADFSPGERSDLQKAFSKKKQSMMDALKEPFFAKGQMSVRSDGTAKVPFQEATLAKLWRAFEASGSYLFNKCLSGSTVLTTGRGVGPKAETWTIELLFHRLHGNPQADPTVCPFCEERPRAPRRSDGMCERCRSWLTKFHDDRGFLVLALDESDGRIRPARVAAVHDNGTAATYEVTLSNGMSVQATANHRFRSPNGYVQVSDLRAGSELVVNGGSAPDIAQVVSITEVGAQRVFDVEMAEGTDHNFVANGIVSHNSHSYAYAQLSWQTAYLKANWPAHYGAALLTCAKREEKRRAVLFDLVAEGLDVRPPSVSVGKEMTSVIDGAIVLGLSEVKGVGKAGVDVVSEREANGPFVSLSDLVVRTGLTSAAVQALAEAGALDEFGPRLGISMAARAAKVADVAIPATEWGVQERTMRQRQRLGLSVGAHPLDELHASVKASGVADAMKRFRTATGDVRARTGVKQLHNLPREDRVRVDTIVAVSSATERMGNTGRRLSMVVDSSQSSCEVVMWPRQYAEYAASNPVPRPGQLLGISGMSRLMVPMTSDDESDHDKPAEPVLSLVADKLWPIDVEDPDSPLAPDAGFVPLRAVEAPQAPEPASPAPEPVQAPVEPVAVVTGPGFTLTACKGEGWWPGGAQFAMATLRELLTSSEWDSLSRWYLGAGIGDSFALDLDGLGLTLDFKVGSRTRMGLDPSLVAALSQRKSERKAA